LADIVDSKRRSELMAGIRSQDTAPELAVRRIAHDLGLRFRLHRKDLPGRPDLVFPKHRLVVFVHGCFWHCHPGCRFSHVPKTRTEYWTQKFARNVDRDKRNEDALKALGWKVLVIWECEVADKEVVARRLQTSVCHSIPKSPTNKTQSVATPSAHSDVPSEESAHLTTPPTFVDVFAGGGGLSLGLKRAGWLGLFAIEKDEFAFQTLSANFPLGDGALSYTWPQNIERRAWDIHELLSEHHDALTSLKGKVDLLAGGPPCQGFSHAGRRQPDDPRNRLFEAYLKLVHILRPRLVLVENVRGFKSEFKKSDRRPVTNFAAALEKGLGAEYDVTSAVIQSRDYGVPQARPRYFLVGALKNIASKEAITSFFDDLGRHVDDFLHRRQLPRWPTARDAISDLEVSRNGTVPCLECKGFQSIGYKAPRTSYQRAMRDGHEGTPPDTRLARHRPDIRQRFAAIINSCYEEGRLNVTISPEVRKAHNLKKMAIRVLDPLDAAPTVTSLPDDLLHYSEPRILTVRETARLQTFPDWFSFKGKYTTGGHRRRNEVPRFTQVANAVPPLLAEQLGLALLRIIRDVGPDELSDQNFADSD
jgi:DNA (cytosine-5)-methyltransferase 1